MDPDALVSPPAGDAEPSAAPEATAARRGPGRPRAADRTEAILGAASELFDEVGYDQLTVQAIAQRAGVGLATIYRRWPTKQALLAETLRQRRGRATPLAGADARGRLSELSRMLAEATLGHQREFLPGLLAAIRGDEELAEALRTGVLEPLREQYRRNLAELLGPDHPLTELLADLAPGICIYRAFAPGDPGDPKAFVEQFDALLAELAGPPAEPSPPDLEQ